MKPNLLAVWIAVGVGCQSVTAMATNPKRVVSLAFVPFDVDTFKPVTPSNIWTFDVTRMARGSLPKLEAILDRNHELSPSDIDIHMVRVAMRRADKREIFIDRRGVVLMDHGCFRLSPQELNSLKKILRPEWHDRALGIPPPGKQPSTHFELGGGH